MEHLSLFIHAYGIWVLLPIMIIDGPIITVIASFMASLGFFYVVPVYFLGVLGNIIGDLAYYGIGRFGRKTFVKKYGKYIGLHEDRVEYIENHYKNHLIKTMVIAKITEAPVIPTLIAAGIAKTDIKKFVITLTAIEIPKVFIIVLIGYYFGKFYIKIGTYFQNTVFAFGVTFLLFAISIFLYKKIQNRKIK